MTAVSKKLLRLFFHGGIQESAVTHVTAVTPFACGARRLPRAIAPCSCVSSTPVRICPIISNRALHRLHRIAFGHNPGRTSDKWQTRREAGTQSLQDLQGSAGLPKRASHSAKSSFVWLQSRGWLEWLSRMWVAHKRAPPSRWCVQPAGLKPRLCLASATWWPRTTFAALPKVGLRDGIPFGWNPLRSYQGRREGLEQSQRRRTRKTGLVPRGHECHDRPRQSASGSWTASLRSRFI